MPSPGKIDPSLRITGTANLIATPSQRCQVLVTPHTVDLAERVTALTGQQPVALTLKNGQTQVEGANVLSVDD